MLIKMDTQRNKYKFYTIITVNTNIKDKEGIVLLWAPNPKFVGGTPPPPTPTTTTKTEVNIIELFWWKVFSNWLQKNNK